MKLSLPLKLGIFVVLLFAAVITACLSWTPIRIRWYTSKLHSVNAKEKVEAVSGLLAMGEKGLEILAGELKGGQTAATFLEKHWHHCNDPVQNDRYKRYPLHLAAADRNFRDVIELLICKGADVNAAHFSNVTPLYDATVSGNKAAVNLLITNGADIYGNAYTEEYSPLHIAARHGQKDIAAILIANSVDIHGKDYYGRDPIDLAVIRGHTETVALLIDRGASTNSLGPSGQTLLHLAVGNNHSELTAFFIGVGMELEAVDEDNQTPLHWAARRGFRSLVMLLTEKGANVNALDRNDLTGVDMAKAINDEKIVSFLRAHGGKTAEELKKETGEKK